MSSVLYPTRLSATLLATVLSLSACGGGGGSDSPGDPAFTPTPAPSSKFAACVQTPAAGTVNVYLNTPRPRREWGTATYAGESLTARFDYASATATRPVQIRYSRVDAVAKTSTLVAVETFDATTGALVNREQYTGRTFSLALIEKQSETVNYTVQTLFPAGVADRSERIVRTFDGEGPVTLSQGRLSTCSVYERRSIVSGSTVTQLSGEQLYYVPGLSFVKSYFVDTNPATPTAGSYRQAALVELDRTTAPVTYLASAAATAPSLAACTASKPNQSFRLTANGSDFASSYDDSLRTLQSGTFNGVATIASIRSNPATGAVSKIRYFDPAVGFLRSVGTETLSNGSVAAREVQSGIPDLRSAPIGQAVSYNVTSQATLPRTGAPVTSAETLTFLGHQSISTLFGTRDTCKVKIDYANDGTGVRSETYYYAPDLSWLRSEAVLASGQLVTREVIDQPVTP